MDEQRKEDIIFGELEKLCSAPGYLHAIAYICFRDNTIKFSETMTTEDVLQQFGGQRLCRTEISTLIGLACKNQVDLTIPPPFRLQEYIEQTERLLEEIHHCMLAPGTNFFLANPSEGRNPFSSEAAFRESIFYCSEGAYSFQYRDISSIKYKNDSTWFEQNKYFSVEQANKLITTIEKLQENNLFSSLEKFKSTPAETWSFLPAFSFTIDEISKASEIDAVTTKSFIDAFTLKSEQLAKFSALDDFNAYNAFPIIATPDGSYISFQIYSLSEALYETPFFWLNDDKQYSDKARKNRGDFTENFATTRLQSVFGKPHIYTNIDIYKGKKDRIGEIDVLVVFADRAIIVQAKSKKLTIAARKGNDNQLRDDFKKAIQDANNQAFICANALLDETLTLRDSTGDEIHIRRDFKEIFPICIISEHYPALSFQARQFLTFQTTEVIKPPFVMDVFLLDVMTEMLSSPLHLLSYIRKRASYGDRFFSNHELIILAHHLKNNLWLDNEYSMAFIEDNVSADLDLAMLSRRNNAPGATTPEGILTKYKDTPFDKLLHDIGHPMSEDSLDLGLLLLELSGETIENINTSILHLQSQYKKDGKHHDIALGLTKESTGLTIHCNTLGIKEAGEKLKVLCTLRKYKQKADTWFGICIDPYSARIKLGINLSDKWVYSEELESLTKTLARPQHLKTNTPINFKTTNKRKKLGRNDRCNCGSGRKYKHCCI